MCAYVGACGSVCSKPTFQFFVFFALLAAVAYSYGHYFYVCVGHRHACVVTMYACMRCVCAPCTAYSHGTTAIAQQICVDHFYACVDIAYVCVCVMGVCAKML